MIVLYGDTINPYLADAANWAQQLFNGWTGKHALNALMAQPINSAVCLSYPLLFFTFPYRATPAK
jgi:hypothetical protein